MIATVRKKNLSAVNNAHRAQMMEVGSKTSHCTLTKDSALNLIFVLCLLAIFRSMIKDFCGFHENRNKSSLCNNVMQGKMQICICTVYPPN